MESIDIKVAKTHHPLLDEIKNRWSARAFDGHNIDQTTLDTLLEAASWAASANNEQPWIYYYAHRNSEGFTSLWNCLMEGNRPWTLQASVLLVACVRKTFEKTGKNNGTAEHDLGMANAQMLLQANHINIYGHLMAGFERHKVIELLKLDINLHPVCMIALGHITEANTLDEPYKSRELTPRHRKELKEFSFVV